MVSQLSRLGKVKKITWVTYLGWPAGKFAEPIQARFIVPAYESDVKSSFRVVPPNSLAMQSRRLCKQPTVPHTSPFMGDLTRVQLFLLQ